MNTRQGAEPLVVSGVEEISWFATAVQQARDTINALPSESRPAAYQDGVPTPSERP